MLENDILTFVCAWIFDDFLESIVDSNITIDMFFIAIIYTLLLWADISREHYLHISQFIPKNQKLNHVQVML